MAAEISMVDASEQLFTIGASLAEACERMGLKLEDFVEVREAYELLGYRGTWELSTSLGDEGLLEGLLATDGG